MKCQKRDDFRYQSDVHSDTVRQSYSFRRRLRNQKNARIANNMTATAPIEDPTMSPVCPFKLELCESELKTIRPDDDGLELDDCEGGTTVTV